MNKVYDVYQMVKGKKVHIDTVFTSGHDDAEDMKRSLVNHDGYDSDIIVEEYEESD